jgi:hypothetical protein
MGIDDKHLNFRVSILLKDIDTPTTHSGPQEREIHVTTVVKINNWFGHIYMFFIKPFHKVKYITSSLIPQIIVPACTARAINIRIADLQAKKN